MREWVIRRQYWSSDRDCILSNQIREHALNLMLHRGSGSVAATAGAAMVVSVWLGQSFYLHLIYLYIYIEVYAFS
jgi:hypothetical protein